ncbi:lysine N(6)-hydroxylase/L-ornithine N(5)-oxygenase family protein [Actinosynnema pretiosum subsp. pretiosum]|uniref:L-lysine N6-monooxygenase MbtG n=1 Tax=Actinosynnema pretiosum subsp. pretiosum TaxID=103721 RepID=A0AA45L749_9PSEU|nr:Putative peptide monooxygenase [Actinosynnema pretiosum subsp. pretiosum]QUF04078.1 lysine N(6)-hydroxylase/L-ornithine N(5)-oxygenase family protein [Actinosynnema pretiosum subsp. pretiosum]
MVGLPRREAGAEVHHDVVGVGFGPANLALAVALAETGTSVDVLFLERQGEFGWHRGMLIEDATMQVSFLKDLATPRNPVSEFGFLNYLAERGRLAEFINQRDFYPTRLEFQDYLEWAAARFAHQVSYGSEVLDVRPVLEGGDVVALEVRTGAGRWRARDVVLAPGLRPVLPDGLEASDRLWHSSELLARRADLDEAPPVRVAVVGSGQSAAEVTAHLHRRLPSVEIHMLVSRYGLVPADDSPFVNELFDPNAVDVFFDAPERARQAILADHRNTNYSVVDHDLITDLYRRRYRERVAGTRRLHLWRMSRLLDVRQARGRVVVEVEAALTDEVTTLEVDVVVCATGYRPVDPSTLLGGVRQFCEVDDRGALRVGRDHRIATVPAMRSALYLQGTTEHSHGLSSSLLSVVAVRAGEIATSLASRARTTPAAQERRDRVRA